MSSIKQRIAAYAAACANLVTQMNELDELRERVRKAQLSAPRDDAATDARGRLRRRIRTQRSVGLPFSFPPDPHNL
jgi:hypothetical protein